MSREFEASVHRVASLMIPLIAEYQREASKSRVARYLASTINHMCRELEDFATPWVSVAAYDAARAYDPRIDLRRCHWDDRRKYPFLGKRLHWEHMCPVASLKKRVLAVSPPSSEAVAHILRDASVAWITKEENAELSAQGFRSNRPDPTAAYEACRIRIHQYADRAG